MQDNSKTIPRPVIKRLLKYLTCLRRLENKSVEWVTSRELARRLNLTSSTVRQDLTYIDFLGVPKIGYEIKLLEKKLTALFENDMERSVAVVGAGALGRAITSHSEFKKQGFGILAVFDNNYNVIGKKVGELVVEDAKNMSSVIKDNNIEIGVIAVPAEQAQAVADKLILCGIKGLLNLSPVHISAPEKIPVLDLKIIDSLKELSYMILLNAGKPDSHIL